MLKILVNKNQRNKGVKVKLAVRTWLVLAVGVWLIYQLRVFLTHKLSSVNGSSIMEETRFEQLKPGKKGLLLMEDETIKPDEKQGKAEAMDEENGEQKHEIQQEEMEEQKEDLLVDRMEKGGDVDDDVLDTVRFDDPMEEIDSLNNDYDDDDEVDSTGKADQESDEDDDSTSNSMGWNEDKVDTNKNDSLQRLVLVS